MFLECQWAIDWLINLLFHLGFIEASCEVWVWAYDGLPASCRVRRFLKEKGGSILSELIYFLTHNESWSITVWAWANDCLIGKFQPFWWILWRLGEDLAMTWQYHLPGFDCDVIGWSLKFGLTWVSSNDGGEHSHTIWYRHHLLWSQSFGDPRLDTYEWTA